MRDQLIRGTRYFSKHREVIILGVLLLFHIFFRFYGFEEKHQFTWDQVDNAWAAKNIIVEHKFPLVGMVAKQNSSIYIGPLYYYFVAIFYFLTNLDPIASVFIAGITSIISFFVLYFFTKKIFSEQVAFVAVFFHTFSTYIVSNERVQWPVNFLAPVSLIIFYLLYKVISGNQKFIPYLAVALGISWQLNFTAIFFFIITLLALPLFPRTKATIKQMLIATPFLLVFFVPNILYDFQARVISSVSSYVQDYYHGFHFLRMIQLSKDAFIVFASVFNYPVFSFLRFLLLPVFLLFYLWKKRTMEKIKLCYLIVLWFLVPWVVLSVYKGEISNYYFILTEPLTLVLTAYIVLWIYNRKFFPAKLLVGLGLVIFAVVNIRQFFVPFYRSLAYHRHAVERRMESGEVIEFSQYDPESYLYYVLNRYATNDKDIQE
ncbi:MAG: glycosyltransferase family 39 protein [bacterium]|nr:glycosyltransferase family 39 protein [bacterium]